MDETKIEQVVAEAEEVKAEEVVEAPAEEAVEAPAEEVAEAPEAEAQEVAEEAVTEECSCGECDACKARKQSENNEKEKKVGIQVEAGKSEAEVEEQTEESVLEKMQNAASLKIADMVMEAIAQLPIEESEEDMEAKKQEIVENGEHLLADIFSVLEEVVAGTTVELTGHQVEVKDFVGTGGKIGMGLPAGINPPCKSEDDESEKKVTIKAYHEGAEEIDYKAKYAESEALMDDLVATVENTANKYTSLVEAYNKVVGELQAYKIAEAYAITVDDATDLLNDGTFEEVCEALDEAEAELAGEEVIVESEEVEAEAVNEAEEAKEEKDAEKVEEEKDEEEAKEEKKEEKKEEEQEKALEEVESVEETPEIEGAVVSEGVEEAPKNRAFSVFSSPIVESKKARKAYSVFAD